MRYLTKIAACALMAVITGGGAVAQQAQEPAPPFCENNEGFDDFDFWVGEWNVYSNDEARNFQGTNTVSKHYNNCLIKENWVSANGGGGFSVNYYNPNRHEWRQVWIANGYSIDYSGGLNEDDAMVLEGTIYGYPTASDTRFRGIWTPEENGDVIQHFDIFDAENDEWKVWFEGRYVRRKNDPTPGVPNLSNSN